MSTEANADRVRARLILQGANIPATGAAERRLHERGTLVVSDFIANAGGVISASVEHRGGSKPQAFATIEVKTRRNVSEVLMRARMHGTDTRDAATTMALARVRAVQAIRRFS